MDIFEKHTNNHVIWSNPLLRDFEKNKLTKKEVSFFFSQYNLYSSNFTKYISAGITKLDNEIHRIQVFKNLWEEAGEGDLDDRHPEIYRKFLKNCLNVNPKNIKYELFSLDFYNKYLNLCLNRDVIQCMAILAYATEGIVDRLYNIFKVNLLGLGFKNKDVEFFNLHIDCDDGHADVLKNIVNSFKDRNNWKEKIIEAIDEALDIRNEFFYRVFKKLETLELRTLNEEITNKNINHKKYNKIINIDNLKDNLKLYRNYNEEKKIDFSVDRLFDNISVLDPRILTIEVGCSNENHTHAHETMFFILEGSAEIKLGETIIKAQAHDIIHVPRWVFHQTINTGTIPLKVLAVTDYGLTGRFRDNSEDSYRQNKEALLKKIKFD